MAITLATGTQVAIASTYGTASNVTAATNAAECVLTVAAGHGIVVGDFVEFTSGWDLATGRIFRVKTVATNDVTLEGFNTTSTTNFPAGTGTGTVKEDTPAQTTASGTLTAIVVGSGTPTHTDRDGRVRVQFPWQRGADAGARHEHPTGSNNAPANPSLGVWLRVMIPVAGANWGGHLVPRPGQEVLVAFQNGNIDRPIEVVPRIRTSS